MQLEPLAIIGIACRLPGNASTPARFWQLLHDGVDAIGEVPADRWDVDAYRDSMPGYGGFIRNVDQFDAAFFHLSPREAAALDPQQRLLLEVSWEALEDAAIDPTSLRGSDAGVFVGIASNDYQRLQVENHDKLHIYQNTGTSAATASGRLSFFFDFLGPAVSVDTASSSSLVTFHLAARSLQTGECQLALAAGVHLILSPAVSVAFTKAGMLSPDGRSRGFDADANGYVRGEGCGVVVMKRLSDALAAGDSILALVRGTAINQDGASLGLTVPSGASQEAVARRALQMADLQPHDISYIEAHGSGTPVGDPIEGNALQAVYGHQRAEPFVLGSVKSNIGHLEAAAGIAGVIKTVLALHHRYIPPHLQFRKLNPALTSLQATIPVTGMAWTGQGAAPLRAGVCSLGLSGTNAHVILEQAPASEHDSRDADELVPPQTLATESRSHLFTLSAKSEPALRAMTHDYIRYLQAHPATDLGQLCHTLHVGRAHFDHRLAVATASAKELEEQLQAHQEHLPVAGLVTGNAQPTSRPKVAFLFPGGGSQYVGMGRQLYETQPVFRATVDQCNEILAPILARPLLEVLYPTDEQPDPPLNEAVYMQPAILAIEYALAKLWESWGVVPDVMLGHSAGELSAACLAGVFSLEDGLELMSWRGQLMETTAPGRMLAVQATEAEVRDAVAPFADRVSIAVINHPQNIVVSGDAICMDRVTARLGDKKITPLQISIASHSPLMAPILPRFAEIVRGIPMAKPRIPIISSLTGCAVDEELTTVDYWCRHLRNAVQFADGLETLRARNIDVFMEIGPKPVLLGIARRVVVDETPATTSTESNLEPAWLPSLHPDRDDDLQMLESAAEFYVRGASLVWQKIDGQTTQARLSLPTYPFQRTSYWTAGESPSPVHAAIAALANPGERHRDDAGTGTLPETSRAKLPVATTDGQAIRIAHQVGQESPNYFRHYRVFGKPMVIAGLYLEIAVSVARDILGIQRPRADDVTFEQPFMLPGEPNATCTLEIVLMHTQSSGIPWRAFSLSEHDGEPTWMQHASASIHLGANVTNAVALELLNARCSERVDLNEFYARLAACHIEYRVGDGNDDGPDFRVLQELRRGDKAALGRVGLHDDIRAEAELYAPHCMLFEAGIQAAMAVFPEERYEQTYIPVQADRVALVRTGLDEVWVYASLRATELEQEQILVDVLLLDKEGIIAEVVGLRFRATTPQTLAHMSQAMPAAQPHGQQSQQQSQMVTRLLESDELQRRALLTRFVQAHLRRVLGLRPSTTEPLASTLALKQHGLDSLMSAELKNRLEAELPVRIPLEYLLRRDSTVAGIIDILHSRFASQSFSDPSSQASSSVPDALAHGSSPGLSGDDQPSAGAQDFHSAADSIPQIHAVVEAQEQRRVLVGDRWVYDFASCNYLGLDLQPEVMDAIPPALKKWGVHPSWTRAVASPAIYDDLERELAELVRAPSVLVFPAVTLLHAGVLPVLAGYDGVILKDIAAHRSIYEACRLAESNGTEFIDFEHNNPQDLERKLARYPRERTKIIAIDGVYSMSGAYPPLPEFARLAQEYRAWVYIDDAHGLGVVGESPSEAMPYGHKGNGIVNYFGLDYVEDRMIYVAGLSKSFSSFGAFITCNDADTRAKCQSASTFIFSGPSPVASLASALAGLRLNRDRGDEWRQQIYRLTHKLVTGAKEMGYRVLNDNSFPIVCVVIGETADVVRACHILWDYGILITPALFPIVPMDQGMLRFSITASNTEQEVVRILEALHAIRTNLGQICRPQRRTHER